MTSSKKQRGKVRCWLTGGGRNNARKSDLALICLHQCRKQTNQTALASGQSRAAPVRSCKEDGGFKFCFSCCSWLSSFSNRSSPGSSSSSLCSAESYRKQWFICGLVHYCSCCSPRVAFTWGLLKETFKILLPSGDWWCSGCETSPVYWLKWCYGTCTCLGQQEELPALSSAAVCGEAEILNASNHADLTTHSVWPVQVITPLT